MTNLNINIFEDINVVLFPAKEHGLSQTIMIINLILKLNANEGSMVLFKMH